MAYVVLAVLGIGFYANGDLDRALTLLDKAIANAGALEGFSAIGQEIVYFHRANVHYDQERILDAISDLERAIAIRPDLYEAHANLALAYAQVCTPSNQIDRAIEEAQTATTLRPHSAAAHQTLGILFMMAQRDREAVDALKMALEYDADDAWTYDLLATALASTDESEEAALGAQRGHRTL